MRFEFLGCFYFNGEHLAMDVSKVTNMDARCFLVLPSFQWGHLHNGTLLCDEYGRDVF